MDEGVGIVDADQVICLLSRLDSQGLRDELVGQGYKINYKLLLDYIDPKIVTEISEKES
jgi:hypothetical protein